MKTRSRITKLIAITMAVAAIAVVGSSWTTEGQVIDPNIRVIDAVDVVGFIPGQRLSLSVANLEEGSQPVRVQAYIYDSTGRLMSRTDPVEVPAGQFHTFIFNRDELPLAGEPGTGRLQVRAGIQVAFMDGSVRPFKLPVSMELVNNSTGFTITNKHLHITSTNYDEPLA